MHKVTPSDSLSFFLSLFMCAAETIRGEVDRRTDRMMKDRTGVGVGVGGNRQADRGTERRKAKGKVTKGSGGVGGGCVSAGGQAGELSNLQRRGDSWLWEGKEEGSWRPCNGLLNALCVSGRGVHTSLPCSTLPWPSIPYLSLPLPPTTPQPPPPPLPGFTLV